jgi:hypothetical protein
MTQSRVTVLLISAGNPLQINAVSEILLLLSAPSRLRRQNSENKSFLQKGKRQICPCA